MTEGAEPDWSTEQQKQVERQREANEQAWYEATWCANEYFCTQRVSYEQNHEWHGKTGSTQHEVAVPERERLTQEADLQQRQDPTEEADQEMVLRVAEQRGEENVATEPMRERYQKHEYASGVAMEDPTTVATVEMKERYL